MKTIIHSAKQLITCAGDRPKHGRAMGEIHMIEDGSVVIEDDTILDFGKTPYILSTHIADHMIDASGKVICPGFVDCHTHAVYAGDRLNEFEQRIQGKSYMEILAAGGGILNTMRATRAATLQELITQTRARLDVMLKLGTTTAEIKSGYGLTTFHEVKLLRAIELIANTHPMDIIPTFLGAHAIPPEHRETPDSYVEHVIYDSMSAINAWYRASAFKDKPLYVDVFCEENAFSVDQSVRIWEAARYYNMGIKAHVDEFKSLGGVTAAINANAVSVDHLDVTADEEIASLAASQTIGVILPAVNFNFGSTHCANARGMIDAGAAIALATDLNPGSAPCPSIPLVMAIACRYQKLLPAEAMNAATINAAYAIGMGERVGSIEAGKQADLLIVNAPDYRALMYEFGDNLVERVIKRGAVVV